MAENEHQKYGKNTEYASSKCCNKFSSALLWIDSYLKTFNYVSAYNPSCLSVRETYIFNNGIKELLASASFIDEICFLFYVSLTIECESILRQISL